MPHVTVGFTGIDHVAIAVHDADAAVPYYRDQLGFAVREDECAHDPGVRLVSLEPTGGGTRIQLVQPVMPHASTWEWLAEHGEGLHHVCLVADDLTGTVAALDGEADPAVFRAGRRRDACFLRETPNGVAIEATEARPSR